MKETWWNRLHVKIPSFCLFINLFHNGNSWMVYHRCDPVHADSIMLHQRISFHNMSSWMVFIWTFVLHSICRSDPNYDNNNDKVFPNASNLVEQAWSEWKKPVVKIPMVCFLQISFHNENSWIVYHRCELVRADSILLLRRISFYN